MVRKLTPVRSDEPEYIFNGGEWDRRAQRFLRDLRMLGLDNDMVTEVLKDHGNRMSDDYCR